MPAPLKGRYQVDDFTHHTIDNLGRKSWKSFLFATLDFLSITLNYINLLIFVHMHLTVSPAYLFLSGGL